MTDVTKIDFSDWCDVGDMEHWFEVARKYREGEPITKAEILEMLESGCTIPNVLNPMFAEIVRGELRFEYPKRKPIPSIFTARFVYNVVKNIEQYITDPSSRPEEWDAETRRTFDDLRRKDGYKNRKRITANQSAVKLAVESLELSEHQIRDKITEHKKSLRQ